MSCKSAYVTRYTGSNIDITDTTSKWIILSYRRRWSAKPRSIRSLTPNWVPLVPIFKVALEHISANSLSWCTASRQGQCDRLRRKRNDLLHPLPTDLLTCKYWPASKPNFYQGDSMHSWADTRTCRMSWVCTTHDRSSQWADLHGDSGLRSNRELGTYPKRLAISLKERVPPHYLLRERRKTAILQYLLVLNSGTVFSPAAL